MPSLRRISLLTLLTLALAAVLAPTGQAQRTPEAEAAAAAARTAERAQRAAAREEQLAASRAQRAAERGARASEHVPSEKLAKALSNERKNGIVTITCTQVSWTFKEFNDAPANTVTEKLKVDHMSGSSTTFTFDGTTGTNVTPIHAPPGSYIIDAQASWRKSSANGANGGFDIHAKVTCDPAPAVSMEKLQRIEGDSGPYTTAPLIGEVGETLDYEIVVSNTGNVPLTLGVFTDARCDAGTISGGPAGGVLVAGASGVYLCKHLLDAADLAAGSYANAVTLTATPPPGEGSPVMETTNTVLAEVKPRATPPAKDPADEKSTTTGTTTPASSTIGATTGAQPTPQSGVLAFSAAAVPSLTAPRGCVRASFHASVKSAGVASVTFYLDGRKLRRMTAHSARKGLLTITISRAKLTVGPHRLLARITMVKASASAKSVRASRSIEILRCRTHVARGRPTR